MAVKLSSYYGLRNNYLVRSLEDKWSMRTFFGGELSTEDKKVLEFIVGELDKLKEDSHFQQGSPLIADGVAILNVVELKDVTNNVELAAAYLQGIHKIMEKHWVQTELYSRLGKCFEELGLRPKDPNVEEAISYANRKIRSERHGSLDGMCWKSIKESEERKQDMKRKNPLKYQRVYGDF